MTLRQNAIYLALVSSLLPAYPSHGAETDIPPRKKSTTTDTVIADGIDVVIDSATIRTANDGTSGLHVLNGGSIATGGSLVSTAGRGAYGVWVDGRGKANIHNSSITTHGDYSHGIYASGFGGNSKIFVGDSFIETTGEGASGLQASGGTVDLKNVGISTRGQYANALVLHQVDLSASGTHLFAGQGVGLVATGNSRLSFTGGSIRADKSAVVIDDGGSRSVVSFRDTEISSGALGFVIHGSSDVSLERVRISINAPEDDLSLKAGVSMTGPSKVSLIDSDIRTTGENANGVFNFGGDLAIEGGSIGTQGYASMGVAMNGLYDTVSIAARNVGIYTSGDYGAGAAALFGGNLVLDGSAIYTEGKNAYGIWGEGGSVLAANTAVTTRGEGSHGFVGTDIAPQLDGVAIHTYGAGANGVWLFSTDEDSHGSFSLRGGSRVETENAAAIRVSGGSQDIELSDATVIGRGGEGILLRVEALKDLTPVEILTDPSASRDNPVMVGTVALQAQRSQLMGDVIVESGSATIALGEDSVLVGALKGHGGHSVDRLSIDRTSTWYVRDNSDLGSLDTAGTVSFITPDDSFKVVHLSGDLTGHGLFAFRTNLGAGQGDLLRVSGTVEGQHEVLVANSGYEPSKESGALRIIESEGGSGTFSLANRDQVADLGTYRYALMTDDNIGGRATDWSLMPSPNGGKNQLSTTANAAINTSSASTMQALWYAETGSLMRRMGELRHGNAGENVWLRTFGERQKLDNGGARPFDQKVRGMQGGADTRFEGRDGFWHVGGFAGLSYGDRRFADEGDGRSNSYHAGAYATYLADSGWYLDSVLKVNRFANRFNVTTTDGREVSAKTRTAAAGLSLEVGQRVEFGQRWFAEPQGQVAVVRTGSDRYTASNGLMVSAEGGTSVQVRTGALFGKRFELQGDGFIQPYVKVGWVQELAGTSSVRTNGISTRTDLSGGRAELGLGVTASWSNAHRIYADYQYSGGQRLDVPSAFSLGYRYVW